MVLREHKGSNTRYMGVKVLNQIEYLLMFLAQLIVDESLKYKKLINCII